MQTPTHALLALALLSKNGALTRNKAILAGSLIPDLFIYICWAWLTSKGISQETIWNDIYFQDGVQFWSGLSNSVPIYCALAIAGYSARKSKFGKLILVFSLAALTHMATDFPFHAEDAHQHFWPITHWKFHSPLSYWDSAHYGKIISVLELFLAVVCIVTLLKRHTGKWVHRGLKTMLGLYSIMMAIRAMFWTGILGG